MAKQEKVNLLNFQKSLNEQFSKIFDAKTLNDADIKENTSLGLINHIKHYNIYLPLNNLKNIATQNSYEEIRVAKSWILGINQVHGEVYTILNLEKVFDLLTIKKTDYSSKAQDNDMSIVYLKPYKDNNVGIVIDKLELLNVSNFQTVLTHTETDTEISWELNPEVDYEKIVKEVNAGELILLNKIKKLAETQQKLSINDIDKQSPELMLFLFKNIYLWGENKVIFVLNINMLIRILGNIPPF